MASLMNAEHVLRVKVNWSTLKSINKNIRQIRDAMAKKKPVEIPYPLIPEWFRQNPKLVDELGSLLPPDRIPKRPKWRPAPQNAIDITLHEVFEAMKVDVEGNDDGQFNRGADEGTRADGVADKVVIRADERAQGRQHGSDKALAIAQRMLEEKTQEYLADVVAYKAKISYLKSTLAAFGIRADGSSSNALFLEAKEFDRAPPMVHTFVQVERDTTIEQAKVAKLHALELSTANQELQSELKVLRQNPFEIENQALQQETEGLYHQLHEANQYLADYNNTRDNMQKFRKKI